MMTIAHLNIFYQEKCNCDGRIMVERMVKSAGKVRKVVVRMFRCSGVQMFPLGGRFRTGYP